MWQGCLPFRVDGGGWADLQVLRRFPPYSVGTGGGSGVGVVTQDPLPSPSPFPPLSRGTHVSAPPPP